MPPIDDYESNPERVLIDAALNPDIRKFISEDEFATVTIDNADGTQSQVQALALGSVRVVVQRIIARGAEVEIDIQYWICSPDEFDLCRRLLNTPVGTVMRQLDTFLSNKWTQGGLHAAGLALLFTIGPVGAALEVFNALGFVNHGFVKLCNCPTQVDNSGDVVF